MTSDEMIGFKKSSKINGLKLDETCRTPNSYFNSRVLIFLQNPLYADTRRPERFQQAGAKEIIYFLSPNALMVLAVNVPS